MQARIRPNIDQDIKPFWDALLEHKFKLLRCKKCGAWYWPVSYCRRHPSLWEDMEWAEACGKGKVFTFNIHRVPFHPAFKDALPYVYALVELDEGPLIGSNIVNCNLQDVKVGMPVKLIYEDHYEDGFVLPKFEPLA